MIKVYILIILLIINTLYYKSYYSFLPTIPIYPDNKKETKLVKKYIKNRTQEDIDFFYKTNISVSYAFLPYVEENIDELNDIIHAVTPTILAFKYLLNRARPSQIDNSIIPINIKTARTPAYPAGHAYQAYYLCNVLTKKYPQFKTQFETIAHNCDLTRVKAGLHYPSDGEFSKYLVEFFS